MNFSADSSIFFQDSPHSAAVGSETAQVLYDAPFRTTELYEGQVETSAPACSMLDADVARLSIIHSTHITIINGQSLVGVFEVIGIEPDGIDMTRLTLTKDF